MTFNPPDRATIETPALPFVVIGAGGHGRVVLAALSAAGTPVLGATDPDAAAALRLPAGIAYLGSDEVVSEHASASIGLTIGIGAKPTLRNPGTGIRRKIFDRFSALGFAFPPVIDPSATLRGMPDLGAGAQILAGVILQPDVTIGMNTVVNTGATIDHDSVLGNHAFIAPGVTLCGNVTIGEGSFVGAGAVVLPGVVIGRQVVIPAGATVGRDVPDGQIFIARRG